ncbi:MAG TPA: response regulator [Ferruginibacter sp.]|nr:response regulator [Ferruginibacter sp.]
MKTGNVFFIVDDDPDDQELFIEALQGIDEFCKCITAFDGEEALKKLNDGIPQPDFIFLDLNMPRMNGKQFLAQIKNNGKTRHIPVIIYSTSSEKKDIQDTTDLGALYFLQKPNRFEELSKALNEIISGILQKRQ